MKRMQTPIALLLAGLLVAVAPGCGSDDEGGGDGNKAKDASGEQDTGGGILFDSGRSGSSGGGDDASASSSSSGGADAGGSSSSSGGEDAAPAGPGEFGWACTKNDECDSGICIATPDGSVCTKICTESCPNGYKCVSHKISSDVTNICVPEFPNLCDPCNNNTDSNSYGSIDNVSV